MLRSTSRIWTRTTYRRRTSHARRSEQGIVKPGEDLVSLPTHTPSNPYSEKVFPVEMPHQRIDQACPDDNVTLNIEGPDKNSMPETHAHARRSEQGAMKPGEDIALLASTHGFEPRIVLPAVSDRVCQVGTGQSRVRLSSCAFVVTPV